MTTASTSHRADPLPVARWERALGRFFEACEWAIEKTLIPILYWEPKAYRTDFGRGRHTAMA